MTIESVSTGTSPMAELLLREVAARVASGVLEVRHPDDTVSHVWVREGRIYAMHVPGYRPALGIRLLSGGLVSPDQLSAAAAMQRDHHPTMLIGQVLVGMGFVSPDVVTSFVHDQVLDQVADLLDLSIDSAAFHPGRRVQHDVIEPADVDHLLTVARERRARRADVLATIGGAGAVPQLGAPGTHANRSPLGPYDWALLCRVDGRRDVTELARVCGFTLQEAAQIVADLTLTELLALPEPEAPADEPLAPVVQLRPTSEPVVPAEPEWHFDGTDAGEPEPVVADASDIAAPPRESEEGLLAELSAFVHDEPLGQPPSPAVEVLVAEPVAEPATATVPAPRVAPDEQAPVMSTAQEFALQAMAGARAATAPSHEAAPAAAPVEPPVARFAEPVPTEPVPAPVVPAPVVPTEVVPTEVVTAAADWAPTDPPAAPLPEQSVAPEWAPAVDAVVVDAAVSVMTADPVPGPDGGFPVGSPMAPSDEPTYTDTSLFMRELSSLSDAPAEPDAPVVTRLVVPLTPTPRKRRFWGR